MSVVKINLFGMIGDRDGSFESVRDQLHGVSKDADIRVQINSLGGSATDGLSIYNLLSGYTNVETVNVGVAASAAALVYLAGSKRASVDNAMFMFHCAQYGIGYASEKKLLATAERAKIFNKSYRDILENKTTITDADMLDKMIHDEKWFSASDAQESGVVQTIISDDNEKFDVFNEAVQSAYTNVFERRVNMPIPGNDKPPVVDTTDMVSKADAVKMVADAEQASVRTLLDKVKAIQELVDGIHGGSDLVKDRLYDFDFSLQDAQQVVIDHIKKQTNGFMASMQGDAIEPLPVGATNDDQNNNGFIGEVTAYQSLHKCDFTTALSSVAKANPQGYEKHARGEV